MQKLLDDSALAVLIDSSWTCLDLYGSNVSDSGVQQALGNTPQLLLLDLSGCKVSQQTIGKLGSWCPQLQVLRIGSSVAFVLAFIQLGYCYVVCIAACSGTKDVSDSLIWAAGLKHIMPTVVQVETVMDSWEVLACEEQGLSKPVVQSHPEHNANRSPLYSRLTKLEYLSWPQIPVKTAHLLAHKYPKVAVNPKSGLCPEHADPATAVDQPLILSVAPFWEPEQLLVCLPTYALNTYAVLLAHALPHILIRMCVVLQSAATGVLLLCDARAQQLTQCWYFYSGASKRGACCSFIREVQNGICVKGGAHSCQS